MRPRNAFVDGPRWQFCLYHTLATRTGIARTHITTDKQLAGHVFQFFGHVPTDANHPCHIFFRLYNNFLAWQRCGQFVAARVQFFHTLALFSLVGDALFFSLYDHRRRFQIGKQRRLPRHIGDKTFALATEYQALQLRQAMHQLQVLPLQLLVFRLECRDCFCRVHTAKV